jgi:hypothetical protein
LWLILGPLGEIYSTHTTIDSVNLTWRFVMGVQLSADFNVTVGDLAANAAGGGLVAYAWDHGVGSFKPKTAADLQVFSVDSPLLLQQSDGSVCQTGQKVMNVTTTCFPAEWYAIAPTLHNGWILLGEITKLMPISNVRISSVEITASGITIAIKGAPSETVEFGAVPPGQGLPTYKSVVVAANGVASIIF